MQMDCQEHEERKEIKPAGPQRMRGIQGAKGGLVAPQSVSRRTQGAKGGLGAPQPVNEGTQGAKGGLVAPQPVSGGTKWKRTVFPDKYGTEHVHVGFAAESFHISTKV